MTLTDYNLITTTFEYHIKKAQYEYATEKYLNDIKNFFNGVINTIYYFPIDCVTKKQNPVLSFVTNEAIPPKLMLRFCEEFGYYAPRCDIKELTDWYELYNYRFTKKIDWSLYESYLKMW